MSHPVSRAPGDGARGVHEDDDVGGLVRLTVVTHAGAVIFAASVPREHCDELLIAGLWRFLDRRDRQTRITLLP